MPPTQRMDGTTARMSSDIDSHKPIILHVHTKSPFHVTGKPSPYDRNEIEHIEEPSERSKNETDKSN